MKKKICFPLLPFLLFGICFSMTNCAVDELVNLLSDPHQIESPNWEIKYDIPLIEKKMSLSDYVNLDEYLEKLSITNDSIVGNTGSGIMYAQLNPIEVNSSNLGIPIPPEFDSVGVNDILTWPLPIDTYHSPEVVESSFPVISIDLNEDGTSDFELSELKSQDGYFKIFVTLQINNANADREKYFDPDTGTPYLSLKEISIQGTSYPFEEGSYDEASNRFVIPVKGFLMGENQTIRPESTHAGEKKIAISMPANSLEIRGKGFNFTNPTPKEIAEFEEFYDQNQVNSLRFYFEIEISLGDSLQLVGEFLQDFTAYSLAKDPINLPFSKINQIIEEIGIQCNMDNNFPFSVQMQNGGIQSSDTGEILDFLYNGQTDNNFVLKPGKSTSSITLSQPLSTINNGNLILDIVIPRGEKCILRKKEEFYASIEMKVFGKAKIDINTISGAGQ